MSFLRCHDPAQVRLKPTYMEVTIPQWRSRSVIVRLSRLQPPSQAVRSMDSSRQDPSCYTCFQSATIGNDRRLRG